MSELRNRMIRDMQLAGLVEGTRREYLRAVRQLTAYYMLSPDRLAAAGSSEGRVIHTGRLVAIRIEPLVGVFRTGSTYRRPIAVLDSL